MPSHLCQFRVYYEDTDSGGIVYYANYLKFAERARTEMLRDSGINQSQLIKEHGVGFVVRRAELDLQKPARLDDLLFIHTEVVEIGAAGFKMMQRIMLDEMVLCMVGTQIVCVDMERMKPARLPKMDEHGENFLHKLIKGKIYWEALDHILDIIPEEQRMKLLTQQNRLVYPDKTVEVHSPCHMAIIDDYSMISSDHINNAFAALPIETQKHLLTSETMLNEASDHNNSWDIPFKRWFEHSKRLRISVNMVDSDNQTPLHLASYGPDHIERIVALIDAGADLAAKDKTGDIPLHCAAWYGEEKVRLLVEAGRNIPGASIEAVNNKGETPLHLAARKMNDSVIEILANAATINARDVDGQTPLHHAALADYDSGSTISHLVHHGADINVQDNNNNTALHLVITNEYMDDPSNKPAIIAELIEQGIDLEKVNNKGRTALHEAFILGNMEAVEQLKEAGAQMPAEYAPVGSKRKADIGGDKQWGELVASQKASSSTQSVKRQRSGSV